MHFQKDKVGLAAASTISKLINQPAQNNYSKPNTVDVGGLESIVKQLSQKEAINEDLLSLFPDMNFCAETVSLSIISPNDMISKKYNLNFNNLKLSSDLKGSLAETIKTNINTYYNFDSEMPDIIRDALFLKGAHVEAFIPESALDDIINSHNTTNEEGDITTESYIKSTDKVSNKGVFEKNVISNKAYNEILNSVFSESSLTTESGAKSKIDEKVAGYFKIENELNVEFMDDYSCLYKGFISKDEANKKVEKLYRDNSVELTNESGNKTSLKSELLKIFKNADNLKEESLLSVESFDETSRKSIGRPLHLKLDMSIVKPIWSVSPENHIGYLVLLDENSSIINTKSYLRDSQDSNNIIMYNSNSNKGVSDGILSRALKGLKSMTSDVGDIENMEELYGSIMQQVIENKIKSGMIGDLGTLSKDQNFLKLMFTRALKGKKTKVLFLPKSVVSYMAYEYRDNGMGLSRLDKISVIISMRAIMLFAKLMANIKNSIPITEVEATIDNKEPDVKAAINKIISSTMKSHQVSLPIGTANINDLVQWVHNLGYVYNISSDRLPDTKVKLNDSSRNVKVPEDTISEVLEELSYMEFFMNSEMVRSGKDVNFATTLVTQNKLFENRILKQQIKTERIFTRHIKTILSNDANLRYEILKSIKANSKEIEKLNKDKIELFKSNNIEDEVLYETILEILIDDITLTLPRATSLSEGNNLKTSLEDYSGAVDTYIDKMFDDEAFGAEFAGEEVSGKIGGYKSIIKKMLIQDWITENNYIPSMNKFLTLDDSGQSLNNLFSQYTDMMEVFGKLAKDFNKKNKKYIDKLDNDLNKISEGNNESEDEEFDNNNTEDPSVTDTTDDTSTETPPEGTEEIEDETINTEEKEPEDDLEDLGDLTPPK